MPDILDRLADKFEIADSGCWLWTAAKNPAGYGVVSRDRRARLAHRVVYEVVVGPIPDGSDLDHLCSTPACIHPDHLEPVSHGENMRRAYWATRTHCPSGHPYDEANTYHRPERPGRECRACRRAALKRLHGRRARANG